ncbi:MAG: DUF1328 domain-containing protein [Halopseudomonas sp.]|uniref:DUF1328 domain-containing protein n=1 Tax=Halopseudomonas sp. TaxID=2901191 RepID=UPI0030039CF3
MNMEQKPAIYFHIKEATLPGAIECMSGQSGNPAHYRRSPLLNWAIAFFIMTVAAAVFTFGGFGATAATLGKMFFGVCLTLFLCTLWMSKRRRI